MMFMIPMPPTNSEMRRWPQEDGQDAGNLAEDRHQITLVDHREVVLILKRDAVPVAQQVADLIGRVRHAVFAHHLGVRHRHQRFPRLL